MDRNAITGIVLITVLTLVYFTFFSPKPAENPETANSTTKTEQNNSEVESDSTNPALEKPIVVREGMTGEDIDSVETLRRMKLYSDFYVASEGEESIVTVTTEKLTVNLNTRGGAIRSVYLNEYETHDSLPLPVVQPHEGNEMFFQFYFEGAEGKTIKSSDLFFSPDQTEKELNVTGEDSLVLRMIARVSENRFLEQRYTFRGNAYDVGYDVRFKGLKDRLGSYSSYEYNWTSFLPKTELSVKNMRQKTSVAYKQLDDVEKLSVSDERVKEELRTPVDWISYKSQFFSAILIPEQSFNSANILQQAPPGEEINKIMASNMKVDWDRSDDIISSYMWYLGPNEYYTLNSYKEGLEKEMDMGWWIISYINIGTTYVFKFLEGFISNYGLIIIILAIMIRTLILPLTFKSFVGMAKMRVLNSSPEMKSLDAKYKDDSQKLQMAKMSVFREMGVNPLGGCLPMLFSYPFLIALFFFFPQSVELRQQSFLWANDLSTYDAIISWDAQIPILSSVYGNHISLFTLLMAISTFVFTWYQQQSQPTQSNPALKYVAYFLPIFLLIFLNNYASGLSLYYLTSNILSITQNVVIRRFIDDEKLLQKMRDSQKKGKGKKGKKSGGGGKNRLERWAESQQKKQKQMARQRQDGAAKNRQGRRRK